MKLIRYEHNGATGHGIIEGDEISVVGDIFAHLPTGARLKLADVRLLAPVMPSKVVCVGLNYTDHAAEMGMPLPDVPIIFLKPSTAVIGPGDRIIWPAMSSRVDFEAELGIVIGRTAKDVSVEDASDYILGYTCVNDVSARDLQKIDGQWTRAKSFDTFCPIGPCIETDIAPSDLLVEAYLNGVRVQSSSTSNMHHGVHEVVSFISRVMTLYPGDVIATGTPPGIGPMEPGDEIEVRISGIGSLINTLTPRA